MATINYEETRALLLEFLKDNPRTQVAEAVVGICKLVRARAGIAPNEHTSEYMRLTENVQDQFWALLIQGILFPGLDATNQSLPWFHVTRYGAQVVDGQRPQPYDPEGFLRDFNARNPSADPVVADYLEEAVTAFNHGCPRAAGVLMGAASEKAILVLLDTFQAAITDPAKKNRFEDERRSTIHRQFRALKHRLDRMLQAKKLPSEVAESVNSEIPGAFDLLRRVRNEAGHPQLSGKTDRDTVFMNLRMFTEYIRRIQDLIAFFRANPAEW